MSQIIFLIEKIFRTLWDIVTGVFYMGGRAYRRHKQEKELETAYYFKQLTKKEMGRWQVREQAKTRKTLKYLKGRDWFPKRHRKDDGFIFHNYFATVLLVTRPQDTPDELLKRYWEECVGPYFVVYASFAEYVKGMTCDSATINLESWEELSRAAKDLPDLEGMAKRNLEVQKGILLKHRKTAEKLKEDRKKALDERDKAMLEIDMKILNDKAIKASTQYKNLKEAKEKTK